MSNDLDWIKPGAQVVVWRDSYGDEPTFNVRTVAKVAAKSFTVEGETDRFQLADLASKRLGSTYHGYRLRVVQVGSSTHADLSATASRRQAEHRAHNAVDEWKRSRRNLAAIDKAVAELTALREALAARVDDEPRQD